MNISIDESWKTIQFARGEFHPFDDSVATELPLTCVVNGEEFATIVCSPTDIEQLVIGFLASEGVIRTRDEIQSLYIDEAIGYAYVELTKEIDTLHVNHSKRFIGSCCGKSRQFYFKSDVQTARTIERTVTITAEQCLALMEKLQQVSDSFIKTGGVHNAALCTTTELLQVQSDIGRHNALDKLFGYMLENKVPPNDKVIVFSGRISSEVLLKVSKMGVGIIISTSAPTNLALQLADDLRITAIGFARGNKMNIYTHPERVEGIEHVALAGK